ncbi:MAG: FHA domain-containing protein [Kiritimatiellae bacterium]|nr:FHA domain-containing protein [Kiritimatiellia bacterium]
MTEIATSGASAHKDNTLLGNVLAIGSRLVSEGRIPQDVIDGAKGAYAICLVARDCTEVRILHAGEGVEVGRSPDAGTPHWRIDDPWMSRRHFLFAVEANGSPALRCLGAKNGTFVNDEAVEDCAPLRRGDVIRAGSSSFLLL